MAVAVLVYANSLSNPFHYDDEHSIVLNPSLRDLGRVPAYFVDPTLFSVDPAKAMYRPLLLVTYALNFALGGPEAFGFHLTNLLIHVFAAAVVWWLALQLTGRPGTALLAGMLFAIHPLTTEPVNYISSRSESLAGLFYLAGVGCYVKAQSDPRARSRARLGVWTCLVLGLLTKSILVTLPLALLAYDYLVGHRAGQRPWTRSDWRRQLVPWAIVASYVGLIWTNGFLRSAVRAPVRDETTQLLTQIKAGAYYLALVVMPVHLNVEHQFWAQAGLQSAALWAAALLLVSLAAVLARLARWPLAVRPVWLCVSAAIVLLPTTIMPLNVLVNEHRLYVSLAVLCVGLAMALAAVGAAAPRRPWLPVGLVALLAVLSFQRNPFWRDDFSLWEDAARKAPLMPRVQLYLGNAHKDRAQRTADRQQAVEQWRAAARAYQRTTELQPGGELALRAVNNLGAVMFSLGHIDAAESAYRRAVELSSGYVDAMVNLGSVFHERGRRAADRQVRAAQIRQALDWYERALKLQPYHARAIANLALGYRDLGELERARDTYDRAARLTPDDFVMLNNMGNLYVDLASQPGQTDVPALLDKAARCYRRALAVNPAYLLPQQGLAEVERRQRQLGSLPGPPR